MEKVLGDYTGFDYIGWLHVCLGSFLVPERQRGREKIRSRMRGKTSERIRG